MNAAGKAAPLWLHQEGANEDCLVRARLRMSRADRKMRAFSERLIAHEAKESGSPDKRMPAAFPIIEKLRPTLATLMGSMGFSALLSRALVLTNKEAVGWRAVHVDGDGSLEGLALLEAQADPQQIAEGSVVLLAQLLGLLVALIGEHLTLRLVSDVWPRLSVDDLDIGTEDIDEKA